MLCQVCMRPVLVATEPSAPAGPFTLLPQGPRQRRCVGQAPASAVLLYPVNFAFREPFCTHLGLPCYFRSFRWWGRGESQAARAKWCSSLR